MRIIKGDHFPYSYYLKWDDGTAIDLSSATSVYIIMTLDGATTPTINAICSIIDATAGGVKYAFTSTNTGVAGMYKIKFKITFTDTTVLTVPSGDVIWMLIIDN
jgi:hypothetical protein